MPVRIKEWMIPYTWGIGIEITNNHVINVLLRELNNLIQVNGDRELYVDLQLPDWIQPSDTFPVGVTTGKILAEDWWQQSWIILNWKTTSWDYVRLIYANDGKLYVDKGTGQREALGECDCVPYTAGEWIEILNGDSYIAMRGPCPQWYHIPSVYEWQNLIDTWETILARSKSTWAIDFSTKMFCPITGWRLASNSDVRNDGYWIYWSCTWLEDHYWRAWDFQMRENHSIYTSMGSRANGNCIRPFKDIPVVPDDSWVMLYDWSSVAEWAWIFHSVSLWLISVSADWNNWITISDKNLWASQIYNYWDTMSEANCWLVYQRWNNYGFPYSWIVATSSTKVDASWYWPWNYYSSATFITVTWADTDWSSVENNNLWWYETWVVTLNNAITNTGVLSVNGKTWHVAIEESNTKTFYLDNDSDIAVAQQVYDWYRSWKNPLIYSLINTKAELYGISTVTVDSITFQSIWDDIFNNSITASVSTITKFYITIHFTSDVVTSISNWGGFIYVLQTNQNYGIPYTPQYAWSPATKKYVDDSINSVSAKVDSTAPSNPTTWQLWYDTVNSTLNVYDGSSWQTV